MTKASIYAARIRVRGLVQGVSFRASFARVASDLGVRGWVKNLPDGSVEAFVQGEKYAVMEMVRWSRRGPPRARVEKVDLEEVTPRDFYGFRITD